MAKTGRDTGPSRSGQTRTPDTLTLPGTDLHLAGSDSDLKVDGGLIVSGAVQLGSTLRLGGVVSTANTADGDRTAATMLKVGLHRTLGATEFVVSDGTRPTITATNGFPRAVMLANADTTILCKGQGFPEEWWEAGQIQFGYEYMNDHTATGNIRFRVRGFAVNIALQAISAATLLFDETFTSASAGANGGSIIIVDEDWDFLITHPTPFDFGTLFYFEVQRIGTAGADTLEGSIGLHTMFLLGEPV